MKLFIISLIAKLIAFLSRFLGFGAGVTWPGEISLILEKKIIKRLIANVKKGVIIVAGTNGKTTTCAMIGHILTKNRQRVILNQTGANLLNGVAGTLILKTDFWGRINADFAVFEVDEATLPLLLNIVKPKVVVLLNLFRDQLDRYGEVDMIARKWLASLKDLNKGYLIANADDPLIAYIGNNYKGKVFYFGLNDKRLNLGKLEFATDSIYCLSCGKKLLYEQVFLSHYGRWECSNCGFKRPQLDLSSIKVPFKGVYVIYDTLAAVLTAQCIGISKNQAERALITFKPVFGRQEEFRIKDKRVQLFLSKNPAGFNASIKTVLDKKNIHTVIFVLNDRIPDGTDVSWIWDVDFEKIVKVAKTIICSGDRAFDMALRIKYAFEIQNSIPIKSGQNYRAKLKIIENLKEAIDYGWKNTKKGGILYAFPTYSAMLDMRKVLIGRKIL